MKRKRGPNRSSGSDCKRKRTRRRREEETISNVDEGDDARDGSAQSVSSDSFNDIVQLHRIESVECAICRSEMVSPVTLDPCGHTFCNSCISRWLIRGHCCPYCKSHPISLSRNREIAAFIKSWHLVRGKKPCNSDSTASEMRNRRRCELIYKDETTIEEFYELFQLVFWFLKIYHDMRTTRSSQILNQDILVARICPKIYYRGSLCSKNMAASIKLFIQLKDLDIDGPSTAEFSLESALDTYPRYPLRNRRARSLLRSKWSPPVQYKIEHGLTTLSLVGYGTPIVIGRNDLPSHVTVFACGRKCFKFQC